MRPRSNKKLKISYFTFWVRFPRIPILLIVALNIYIAKLKNESAIKLVIEHVFLAVVVITISYFTGKLIGGWIQ